MKEEMFGFEFVTPLECRKILKGSKVLRAMRQRIGIDAPELQRQMLDGTTLVGKGCSEAIPINGERRVLRSFTHS